MTYVVPMYGKGQVRRAGRLLASNNTNFVDRLLATQVMTNWRASHGYLLNTFQSTLRTRLQGIPGESAVGQRLKRAPSIIAKLRRFDTMQLDQMQDIAGLRAIVNAIPELRDLRHLYVNGQFAHELERERDYVARPKLDGYRSIHLVYKYRNARAPEYDGMFLELQLRTRLQHAWATAVETVDAFMNQAIKAGRPAQNWGTFFSLASAAMALEEQTAPPEQHAMLSRPELLEQLREAEHTVDVLRRLRGFSVAAQNITTTGSGRSSNHLVILNTETLTLTIQSFPRSEQQQANAAYSEAEEHAREGRPLDPVLITGGSVHNLRTSFPNYFLDTQVFVERITGLIADAAR